MSKPIKSELAMLVQIGQDAANGLICRRCGRGFRKATGRPRVCKRCSLGGIE